VLDFTFAPAGTTFETLSEEAWDAVFDINTKSYWLAVKYAARHLRASGRGPSVVNASSVAGLTGYQGAAYSASKGATIQLNRSLAIQLAPDIRCNCYCPGSIKTPMSDGFLELAEDKAAQEQNMSGNHLIPRRGRPDEFARYLEDLANVTLDVLSSASHQGSAGRDWAAVPGSDRLTLARAARTGLAAGLGLLGVSAPERLLTETYREPKL